MSLRSIRVKDIATVMGKEQLESVVLTQLATAEHDTKIINAALDEFSQIPDAELTGIDDESQDIKEPEVLARGKAIGVIK